MALYLVVLLFAVVVYGFQPGDVVYQVNFHSAKDLKGWSNASWVTFSPGLNGNLALNCTVPQPAPGSKPESRMISTSFNASMYSGYVLYVIATIKAIGVSEPSASYLGIKIMLSFSSKSGATSNLNPEAYGTFDWDNQRYRYLANMYADSNPDGHLSVGLQDSYGTVLIDSIVISVFRTPPYPLPAVPVNPLPAYTGHPAVPRLRGVMSPNGYVDTDMQNLGQNWKANVMRWQMNYGLTQPITDTAAYAKWLNAKLNETDSLLVACHKYGIKVVVDLHSKPGGRDSVLGDLFLTNLTYQNQFFEVWKNISIRYRGNPAVWGYDIANEPLQNLPGEPGTLQWNELAEKTVQIIRANDPDTTIFIASEQGGGPGAFSTLRPVNDSKTVYQVHMYTPMEFTHQDVYPQYPPGPVYPGLIAGTMYNKTQLKTVLQVVRTFQLAFNVQIYVGEFSAVRWAANGTAYNYLADLISIFEEYGWDWTYHAYREFNGWSVEYDENKNDNTPAVNNTTRKNLLLSYFSQNGDSYATLPPTPPPTPTPSPSPSSSTTVLPPSSSTTVLPSSSSTTVLPSSSSSRTNGGLFILLLVFIVAQL